MVDHLMTNADAYGLTIKQRGYLRQAQRLQGGNRADRKRAREYGLAIQRETEARARAVSQAAVERSIADGLRETVGIENRHHGGRAISFNDAGACRLISRDGLATLHEAGKLTAAELQAGLYYRGLYERLACDLRSQLDDTNKGGSAEIGALVAARFAHARDGLELGEIEARVVEQSRGAARLRGVRELRVLRAIAGEGRALDSLTKGGAMRAVYVAALVRALAAVAPNPTLLKLTT